MITPESLYRQIFSDLAHASDDRLFRQTNHLLLRHHKRLLYLALVVSLSRTLGDFEQEEDL